MRVSVTRPLFWVTTNAPPESRAFAFPEASRPTFPFVASIVAPSGTAAVPRSRPALVAPLAFTVTVPP